jgi:hypothetical protein
VNYTMAPAAQVALDVLVLLRRGRVAPTLAQFERLPAMIRDELLEAGAAGYEAGYAEGQRALAAEITGQTRRRRPGRLDWLKKAADPELRERAIATLRLDDRLFDRLLAGGVTLSAGQWKRLHGELGP